MVSWLKTLRLLKSSSPSHNFFRYSGITAPHWSDHDTRTKWMRQRIDELEEELRKEQSERMSVQAELDKAFTHAVCAGWEVKSLQERLNRKTQGKKRKVQVTAQYVTSADAARILKEHEQAEEEKQKREEAAQEIKKAKDEKRKEQREAGGLKFSGSITSKNRGELLDIAYALRLTGSDSNTSETKAQLVLIINAYLDNHPQLAVDEMFSGLFLSRERARKRNGSGENIAPSRSTLPTNSPPQRQSPPPTDLKPSDEPPMVLFNKTRETVGPFRSANPPVPPTFGYDHLASLVDAAESLVPTQQQLFLPSSAFLPPVI